MRKERKTTCKPVSKRGPTIVPAIYSYAIVNQRLMRSKDAAIEAASNGKSSPIIAATAGFVPISDRGSASPGPEVSDAQLSRVAYRFVFVNNL